jgi:hypothetical protein
MEIVEFEKAFRAATANGMMRPILATAGQCGQLSTQLPPEFEAARNSLASRSLDQARENSLLRAVAAQWS